MTGTEQLKKLIQVEYDDLDAQGTVAIVPADLAFAVYHQIDRRAMAPELVKFAAILELRQLAREVCRSSHRVGELVAEQAAMQSSLFDVQLQPRYPAHRGDDDAYVLRAHLTVGERRLNVERLRKESSAKTAHADALEAETEHLLRMGMLVAATT